MKIYYYRHQAAGVLYEVPLSGPPTERDLSVLRKLMLARHGPRHPKTGEAHWDSVVEVDVLEPGSIDLAAEAAEKAPARAAAPEFVVGGTGEVK